MLCITVETTVCKALNQNAEGCRGGSAKNHENRTYKDHISTQALATSCLFVCFFTLQLYTKQGSHSFKFFSDSDSTNKSAICGSTG